MNNKEIINKTIDFVKEKLAGDSSGHDWWHIYRVWNMSKKIQIEEGGDIFIIEMAALLHDVADWKFYDNEEEGNAIIQSWLDQFETSVLLEAKLAAFRRRDRTLRRSDIEKAKDLHYYKQNVTKKLNEFLSTLGGIILGLGVAGFVAQLESATSDSTWLIFYMVLIVVGAFGISRILP